MKNLQYRFPFIFLFTFSIFFLTGCLSTSKFDNYVASQYNNQITKVDKKKTSPEITIGSVYGPGMEELSSTVKKTSKFLPLIVYWSFDYRHTCTLNPLIAVNSFANTVNSMASKNLAPKLAGRKLDLKVEQVPNAFALVDKAHIVWVIIYAFSWDKIYMEPDFKDLIVSYNLSGNGQPAKTGKITIKNNLKNQNLRFFQSWKSAISEYLGEYNVGVTNMSRSFVNKLVEEL